MSKGRGIINIHLEVWKVLGCPRLSEAREKLLLPVDFEVEKIEKGTDIIAVWVTGESIPNTGTIFDVVPIYQKEGYKVTLNRIDYR